MALRSLPWLLTVDLTAPQLKIVLLVASGAATTGKKIADVLHVTQATVSTSVDPLVELGFLGKRTSESDRRVTHLEPSAPANEVYEALAGSRTASARALSRMEPADLESLARGTRALLRLVVEETERGNEASPSFICAASVG